MSGNPNSKPTLRRSVSATIIVHLSGLPTEVFKGVSELAEEYGWQLVDPAFSQRVFPGYLPEPKGAMVTCLPDAPETQRLFAMDISVVRLGTAPHPQDNLVPAVVWDYEAAGRLAADHFAERGFRNIAYIGHRPWSVSQGLYEGLAQRTRELDCILHLLRIGETGGPGQLRKDTRYELLVREVGNFLLRMPRPLALFAYHDWFAAQLCQICRAVGLTVPEDIAILGFGNTPYPCQAASVPLSSIEKDRVNYGKGAVRLLKEVMDGRPPRVSTIKIPPKGIVERQSTNMLAVSEPVVARALRFIWDHIDQPISVDDVAGAVAVSRSTLKRAFRRCLKRGVAAEVQRKRLEHCKELLRDTDYTLAELADMLNFSSGSYLHNLFRKHFGMTPGAYRKGRNPD